MRTKNREGLQRVSRGGSRQVRKGRYYKGSLRGAKAASSVIGEGRLAILMGLVFKAEPDLV